LLPRYARRTREVDAVLIGLYLSGEDARQRASVPAASTITIGRIGSK
jgi:hypothetical protein